MDDTGSIAKSGVIDTGKVADDDGDGQQAVGIRAERNNRHHSGDADGPALPIRPEAVLHQCRGAGGPGEWSCTLVVR